MSTLSSFLPALIDIVLMVFAHDFLRYVIGAGGVFLIVNGVLAKSLAGRRIRERVLGEGQIKRELLTSLRTVFVFSMIGVTIGLGLQFGWLQFYADPSAHGWPWFAVSIVLMIVLQDTWFYWTHRIIHHPRLFRRFHRTHHKSYNPTPLTAYAFDTEEAVVNAVFVLLMGLVMPVSFLALFVFTAHMMLRNAVGHCGYELFPRTAKGRPLFDWMTTVTHHDLHHSQAGWNYGLYFTFWDRAMGTEHPEYYQRFAASVRRELKPETKGQAKAAAALAADGDAK